MKTFAKTAAIAIAMTVLGTGAAMAAEMCACCKDGEKIECCDKMKGEAAAPKPKETPQVEPEHKH